MNNLGKGLERWGRNFWEVYEFHRFVFIYSSIIMLLLLIGWSLLCYIKYRNRKSIWYLGYSILFVLAITNLFRVPGTSLQYKPLPGWSYIEIIENKNIFLFFENLANVLVYFPVGYFCTRTLYGKKYFIVVMIILVPFFMELTQFLFRLGLFEWDDLFHNILGEGLGFFCCKRYYKHSK